MSKESGESAEGYLAAWARPMQQQEALKAMNEAAPSEGRAEDDRGVCGYDAYEKWWWMNYLMVMRRDIF